MPAFSSIPRTVAATLLLLLPDLHSEGLFWSPARMKGSGGRALRMGARQGPAGCLCTQLEAAAWFTSCWCQRPGRGLQQRPRLRSSSKFASPTTAASPRPPACSVASYAPQGAAPNGRGPWSGQPICFHRRRHCRRRTRCCTRRGAPARLRSLAQGWPAQTAQGGFLAWMGQCAHCPPPLASSGQAPNNGRCKACPWLRCHPARRSVTTTVGASLRRTSWRRGHTWPSWRRTTR